MKNKICILLFVFFPLFTFSQKWNEPQAYEIMIPYLMSQNKEADSLKIILYSTTDTSVICFPANQYHDYINGDSISFQEIPYRKIDYIYFNKRKNSLGKSVAAFSGFGLALGLMMGGSAFADDSNNYVDPYLILAFSTISLTIIGSITGMLVWTLRSHVNVGFSKTITKKNQDKINKFVLKKVE